MNRDAVVEKVLVNVALGEVGAGDFVAGGLGHQGEWAHTGARYARNVDFHVIIIIQ